MRHVPTALYIDTEVFKGQSLRLDSKAFILLIDTFVKEGIRLLVPEIMERELLRHYKNQATKATNDLLNAYNAHPINSLPLNDIPSQKDLETECLTTMVQQWEDFKKHFIVEKLPLVGCLEDVIDWYFNIEPPFEPKKLKEFPDAFILSALDHYHKEHKANIAVISKDGGFYNACNNRRYMWCFTDLNKYAEAFKPEISGEDREPEPFDPTKPITTEDLTEMKAILGRSNNVTSIEIRRVLQLLKSRGSNYDYFFQNARDPIWFDHLSSQGFFQNPPEVEKTAEGSYRIPDWPPLYYLVRVYEASPEKTLAEIEKIPDTNNFRVLDSIVEIVLKSDSANTIVKFSHKILSFIDNFHWGHDKIIELLKKPFFFDKELSEFASSFLFRLVEFLPDPKTKEKQKRRKENPDDSWTTLLEPSPHFHEWEYQQILENGIRPLTEQEPYQVSRILIDATASMIRLSIHLDDLEKGSDEDFSEIWCRHLDHPGRDHQDSKETLVQTLTFACGKVYEKVPDLIEALDQALRNQQWKVFKRLRQHLYSLNPSDQTLPWIREFILEYKDYDKWDYHYEFQLMICEACEHFDIRLLSELERMEIFDAILSGPPKEDFCEWMGEGFTEEKFQQRQRNFHRKQLHPFRNLLSGKYKSYFDELESALKDKPLSDDDYMPVGETQSGRVSYQSPRSPDELTKLNDEELLKYINDWQEIHHDKNDWLIEINIEALAGAFQSVFRNTIVANDDRLAFWLENYKRIERPIYIRFLIKAIQDLIKEHSFEKLEQWIGVCNWVLSHPDIDNREELRRSDELKENPDWRSSRRVVIDFLDACLKKDSNIPINVRDSLTKLLRLLCTQFDWRLDRNKPVLLNRDDSLTEALNNTRSLALEKLVNFGFWVRRHLPEDVVPEVTEIFEERFKPGTEFPLTKPEYAILGVNYARIFNLNHDWAIRHKTNFFPQENIASWLEAFGNYLRFNHPTKQIFVTLKEDFVFALDHLKKLETMKPSETKVFENLGQHLFTYYLWEVFPLKGKESLLERYYEKTATNHQYWENLFDYVGHSLKNSGKFLETGLVERITAFFDWRFEVNEPEELQKFTYWLAAECLDPDWRLNTYLKILNVNQTKNMHLSVELETLNKLLTSHTGQVVDCFAKITDSIDQNGNLYLQVEKAKPILKAGLNSEDSHVQKNAERARENLLRVGRFDFLDIA
ncbi:MAG: PIN domain-containing protein [Nitrosomonas sp.]|uniref:PIN domain-containing protein n=1 Tax=Nitrosomonas sp. TaxID=42353 RepID=UPI002734CDC7|nr:PIN domain-containing protein [Nitrosomonas sp.]MDP3662829.1 PIN domain-containing protein [Nitrosomonas sp.]MDZ4107954.1 PIN domain-containing protein [Nitrosomonas sp.]